MRFYRALLHLYPASFRHEYGGEMIALFAERARLATGWPARLALGLSATADVVTSAAAAHWDILVQDLWYTARTLGRSPGFALTAILVTALGVGANAAAFSVADFVMLRPLPFAEPDQLVRLWEAPPGYQRTELSPPDYHDWKAMTHSFDGMGAFHDMSVNMVGEGDPQRVAGIAATAEVLPLLGVQPMLGRVFSEAEERAGTGGTVVLSYGLWQSAFGGETSALGRTIRLDGSPYVVIGVMPRSFHFPNRDAALWTPMSIAERDDADRDNHWFQVVARLRRGVSLEQARVDLNTVAARLARTYPKFNENEAASVFTLREEVSGQSRLLLLGLVGASACILLIACANLANLLIARSLARRRELDVRAALGAGHERLFRQLVTENLTVGLLGGGFGIVLAIVGVPLLARLVPASLPAAGVPSVDTPVLAFALALTVATGLGFGVLPAVRASGTSDLSALRDGARAGGGQQGRLRAALVVGEVAMSVVLLVSSGLLLRALVRVQGTDPGFRTDGVLTMQTALPSPAYDSTTRRVHFYTTVLTGVRALPGVENAAYISGLPFVMGGGIWPVTLGGERQLHTEGKVASLRFVTPDFFAALGIPLRAGRDVAETDLNDRPLVAVVSESFARRYWPTDDPLGKRFHFANDERTVVGVVGDIRVRGLERASEPQVYLPYKQVQDGSLIGYMPKDLVIRASVPPASLVGAVRSIVHEADAEQPISHVEAMSAIVADQTASRLVQLRVLGALAVLALLLAAVGIHGLLAFTVSERQHEIGVRMALGAHPTTIAEMVMRQSAILAALGVAPGILVAYLAGHAMGGLLAGIRPDDLPTFLVATGLCVIMTLAGSLLPVLRAIRVAPAAAFRGG